MKYKFNNDMYYALQDMLIHADEISEKELTVSMSCISYDIASKMKNINTGFIGFA